MFCIERVNTEHSTHVTSTGPDSGGPRGGTERVHPIRPLMRIGFPLKRLRSLPPVMKTAEDGWYSRLRTPTLNGCPGGGAGGVGAAKECSETPRPLGRRGGDACAFLQRHGTCRRCRALLQRCRNPAGLIAKATVNIRPYCWGSWESRKRRLFCLWLLTGSDMRAMMLDSGRV